MEKLGKEVVKVLNSTFKKKSFKEEMSEMDLEVLIGSINSKTFLPDRNNLRIIRTKGKVVRIVGSLREKGLEKITLYGEEGKIISEFWISTGNLYKFPYYSNLDVLSNKNINYYKKELVKGLNLFTPKSKVYGFLVLEGE